MRLSENRPPQFASHVLRRAEQAWRNAPPVRLALAVMAAIVLLGPIGASAQSFPARPSVPPGGTNWVPTLTQSTAIGLATVDICGVQTAQDLVNCLVKAGPNAPTISNVSFTGVCHAAGSFTGGTGIIGFESGIILSSGNVASVVGPNVSDGITTNNSLPGDPDLNALIPGYSTLDATALEFDFECTKQQVISFKYVFTSDEYNEYVNSSFNDVFAFFVDGVNIALIPTTVTPVSINNLNCGNPYTPPLGGSHCGLFVNNDLSDGGGAVNTEMDGLTVVLTATTTLAPGLHHIKLAIADAGDQILDSNVFLSCESFTCEPPPPDDSCPRSAGFWKQQCEQKGNGSTKFSAGDVAQIGEEVDDLSTYFNWSAGTDFGEFCARINPPTPMAKQNQALRQYAAMLANVATGELGLIASNGDKVYLNQSTPIACAGFSATTIGGLIVEIDAALLALGTSAAESVVELDESAPYEDGASMTEGGEKSPANALYSKMIDCLDAINNGIGIGPICPENDVELGLLPTRSPVIQGRQPELAEGAWLARPTPNPFSGSMSMSYRVSGTGEQVRFAVYDVSGRKVRDLVHAFQPAGEHTMSWDSRGEDGFTVRPGMYFIRGSVGDRPVASRVTLVQ